MTADQWRALRSRLNHVWLARTYVGFLRAWNEVLAGGLDDGDVVQRFVQGDLREWEERAPRLRRLLEAWPDVLIQEATNTGALVPGYDIPPWFVDVAIALWLGRTGRNSSVVGLKKLDAANTTFYELSGGINDGDDLVSQCRPLLEEFQTFQARCAELARTVDSIPARVTLR